MVLAPGAVSCPNCHLNLQQFAYQQQYAAQFAQGQAPAESNKEKLYRKLLVAFAIVLMSEFVLTQLPYYFGMYTFAKVINWLDMLIWMGVPLTIALVLPKNMSGRVVLIVFASIYILLRILMAYRTHEMYSYF